MVLSCLGNDQDVAGVLLGDAGALALMARGSLLVDHTTISPAMARRIAAEAGARGVLAVDAPVSGGQAGAGQFGVHVKAGHEVHGAQVDFVGGAELDERVAQVAPRELGGRVRSW